VPLVGASQFKVEVASVSDSSKFSVGEEIAVSSVDSGAFFSSLLTRFFVKLRGQEHGWGSTLAQLVCDGVGFDPHVLESLLCSSFSEGFIDSFLWVLSELTTDHWLKLCLKLDKMTFIVLS
jgi:hypothetical protein